MAWFLMLNADMGMVNWVEIGLTYGVLGVIILGSLIALAIVKKRAKNEATVLKLKAKCQKALAYTNKLLGKRTKRDLLIASTKLAKLSSLVAEAEWCATCIFEEKKDLTMEGLASRLDSLSTNLSTKAEEAFFNESEYCSCLEKTKAELSSVIQQAEALMPKKEDE